MQKTIYIQIDTLIDNTVECNKLIKRGDTISLTIKVFTNGVLADLTGKTIDLILRKSDNTIIEKAITSIANGVITVVLTENATLSEGLVSGEIQIYNSISHIGTNTFTFNVSNSIADDVLAKSENEIETLIDLKTVIDSNNATISEYVSNITQIAGTAESVQALAGTKLYIDTNLEDLQQANAESVINIVNENTQNDEATQNIANLTTLNNTANTLNLDLEGNISNGNILNADLESNIATGNILKASLETDIVTGNATKTNLDSSIATGNTLKANIDSENTRAEANIVALENFGDATQLAQDVNSVKTEVETARNGEVSLDARLDKNDVLVASHSTSLSDLTYQTAGGTATAITLTTQTLANGYAKTFIASANNAGAATTINGKPLYKPGTTTAPNLISGKAYTVWYNSASNCFFIKASAEGDVVAANVLASKKFSNDTDTGLVGTMPNNGALNSTIATAGGTYSIPLGYTSGGTITAPSLATVTAGATVTDASQIVSGYSAISKGILYNGTGSPITLIAGTSFTLATETGGTLSATDTSYTSRFSRVVKNQGGVVRVSFSLYVSATGNTAYARIYVNGVPVGIERISTTLSSNPLTFTEDISVNANDTIAIYLHKSSSGSGWGIMGYVTISCGNNYGCLI